MSEAKYLFGPVPSRRMGLSLDVSPIPKKTCNYSCVYCQLGRTDKMTNTRKEFFPLEDILAEFDAHLQSGIEQDVVTIVGEGEPTLYSRLGELIDALHERTDKPIVVITNAALMYDPQVRADLMKADIVLPSMDACTPESFKKVDRPFGTIDYDAVVEGLITFSHEYQGKLYLEIMLIDGYNDSTADLEGFKEMLGKLRYDRLYLNTAVRPPAEADVNACSKEKMAQAVEMLGGISIDMLAEGGFSSDITDDYEAILSIIGRHPMNQHEIQSFLANRNNNDSESIFERLNQNDKVERQDYKGYITYRLR